MLTTHNLWGKGGKEKVPNNKCLEKQTCLGWGLDSCKTFAHNCGVTGMLMDIANGTVTEFP